MGRGVAWGAILLVRKNRQGIGFGLAQGAADLVKLRQNAENVLNVMADHLHGLAERLHGRTGEAQLTEDLRRVAEHFLLIELPGSSSRHR